MPAVCTGERVTEIEVRTVKHTRRCRCQVQVSGPRIGIVHGVGEGRGDPKFPRKEVQKRTRKFSQNKNRAGGCPPTHGRKCCARDAVGQKLPNGGKKLCAREVASERSALILEERAAAAAAAVLRQQTYCCCSGLQNRTRFSDEKDLGRNRQT
ncbi:unnamed protein product [Sphagnum balticum]